MKINMMLASLICLMGLAAVCANAQANNSATSKIKIVALPNGAVQVDGQVMTTNGMVTVQIHHEKIEMQNMDDNSRNILDLLAIHDPRTHFVFWHVQRGLNTNSLAEWCNHMWLIPDVGLIRIGCSHSGFLIEIYL